MMSLIYGTVREPGEKTAGLVGGGGFVAWIMVGVGSEWLTLFSHPASPVSENRPFGHLYMLGDGLDTTTVVTFFEYL